jgi:ribonuclease P protein component
MSTIKSSSEIQTVFEAGRRAAHPLAVVLVLRTPEDRDPEGRVAYIAGKRLGGAVQRNRAKRVLRAALHRLGGPWPGYDVALIAREKTATAPSSEIDSALIALLKRARVTS